MRALLSLILCCGLCPAAPAPGDPVAEVNARVARIDESLRSESASSVVVSSDGPIEGRPPEIRFSVLAGRLVAARVSSGHETWTSRVTVYFYDDGRPMKYLRSISGRVDAPPRQAILYAPNGQVLWRNVDEPLVDPAGLRAAYQQIESLRRASARY